MLRTIAAVIAGYAAIAILFIAGDVLLGGAFHAGRQVFTVVNLIMALPYGVAGGYITNRISRGNSTAALGLCVLAAGMSIFTLSLDRGRQPLWYAFALTALIVAGAFGASQMRSRYRKPPSTIPAP